MRYRDLWRATPFRLAALYGLLFAVATAALLGLVYGEATDYLTRRVDGILADHVQALAGVPAPELPRRIELALALSEDRTNIYALFSPSGGWRAGNLSGLPARLRTGGRPREVPATAEFPAPARLVARRLADGDILVVGRDVRQLRRLRAIIGSALAWSGAAILGVGLLCGVGLSLGPIRRLRALQRAAREIAAGDLKRRLPTSPRHDELDTIADTVNRMVEEIERLMGEVKASTETIAHDLRTPLTRARARLHRLQQAGDIGPEDLARVIAEVDEVLDRFRAILRIAEIEARERRAGFAPTNLGGVVESVADLYKPLAEERGIDFAADSGASPAVDADARLLVEAVSNLVDNALKFTPPGGRVRLRLAGEGSTARIVVEDSGPGIPPSERGAVLGRFYRGERARLLPGSGLGLSVVAAIVRLHGFTLRLEDAAPGLRAVIECGA
jgi:signal transduction histidine kinase